MNKTYRRPVKTRKTEAAGVSAGHAVDSLSPREYTLQRRIDSYLKAKKQQVAPGFDVLALKKDLQSIINSYGKAVNNKKKNPLAKKLGYYYAILMDIEGKSPSAPGKKQQVKRSPGGRM